MNLIGKQILMLISILFLLQTQGQTEYKCYKDFNLFMNQGIGPENACDDTVFVQCFYNNGIIFKIKTKRISFSSQVNDYISVSKKNNYFFYGFKPDNVPAREKISLTIFHSKKWKWYDTLAIKQDTIFQKSLSNSSLSLSQCFVINGDTFKIISFRWVFSFKTARKRSLVDFIQNRDIRNHTDSTEIIFTLNSNGTTVIKYKTNRVNNLDTEKTLNDSRNYFKTPDSIFWYFVSYQLHL
jgi:hypothetical protein